MKAFFKNISLRYRAAFASALTLLVFFSMAGFGLQRAYDDSLNNAAESELRAYMLSLLGEVDVDLEGDLQIFDLSIAAFNQPNSGVYAEIWNQKSLLWRSESLIGQPLPKVESRLGEYRLFSGITGRQSDSLNVLSLLVDWNEDDIKQQFSLIVANDAQPYIARQSAYKSNLLLWLLVIGSGLVVLQILLFRWLFQPIAKVMDELKNIQKGKQADFEGIYPQEVSVLTRSLNDFLKAEQRQIQRIKDSLGNLAHSLKTPLAAMRGELSDEKFNKVLFEQQVERIATVVDYQLNRTSTSMRPSYRQAQKCYDSVNRLVLVMRRLHEDKGILIHAEMDEDIVFFGDLDDLTEIIGNILENACKWAKSQVTIRLENQAMNKLYITILDDGPGIPDDKVEEILTRGKRLDMNSEGQGIGLAMVNDLVDSYSGSLSFESVKDHHSDFESGLTVIILI